MTIKELFDKITKAGLKMGRAIDAGNEKRAKYHAKHVDRLSKLAYKEFNKGDK